MNKSAFSAPDRILFAKRLAVLLKAGVPILESLKMLKEQTVGKRRLVVIEGLIADVSGGQALSAGLLKYKKSFGDFAIHIIQVGESTGQLHESLHYLAQELQKRGQLQKKIIAALVYPVFVVVATVAITLMLTLYVFPKILPVFQSFHFPLPLPTRILMAFTDIVLKHIGYFFLGFTVLIAGFFYLLNVPWFRFLCDRIMLRLPLLGPMFRSYFIATMCRNFGLLLQSGVPIVDAATITSRTISHSGYKLELRRLAKHIARGEKIAPFMEMNNFLFPPSVRQMVSVGELTGNLSGSFLYLAENYESEVDESAKNLSGLIEPLLMVGMGLAVGFVAIAIITPIYQITQNLHP